MQKNLYFYSHNLVRNSHLVITDLWQNCLSNNVLWLLVGWLIDYNLVIWRCCITYIHMLSSNVLHRHHWWYGYGYRNVKVHVWKVCQHTGRLSSHMKHVFSKPLCEQGIMCQFIKNLTLSHYGFNKSKLENIKCLNAHF